MERQPEVADHDVRSHSTYQREIRRHVPLQRCRVEDGLSEVDGVQELPLRDRFDGDERSSFPFKPSSRRRGACYRDFVSQLLEYSSQGKWPRDMRECDRLGYE